MSFQLISSSVSPVLLRKPATNAEPEHRIESSVPPSAMQVRRLGTFSNPLVSRTGLETCGVVQEIALDGEAAQRVVDAQSLTDRHTPGV
eukprot:1637802-Rhodomonas_salina.1